MEVRAGMRLSSPATGVEVMVIKGSSVPAPVTCDGTPMVESGVGGISIAAVEGEPAVLIGKRYVEVESGLELLCVRGGHGQLGFDGRLLTVKDAKPLPSSD